MTELLPVRAYSSGPNPELGQGPTRIPGDDASELKAKLGLLWRYKALVLGATAMGVGLAALHLYRQPAAYGSTASVRFSDARRSLTSGIGVDESYGSDQLQSEIQILQSRRTLGAVADELDLKPRDAAIGELRGGLRVSARPKTSILDVTFTADDPIRAQRVANGIATVYQEQNALAAQLQSRRRREFLESQLTQTDSVLAEAQQRLSGFRRRQEVYSARDRFSAEQGGLFGLDVRLQELEADRRLYQTMLAAVQSAGSVPDRELATVIASPGIAGNPVVSPLYAQLVDYQRARDTLTAGAFGSSRRNPDVQRLDTLIATTRERIVAAVRSHVGALSARLDALRELRATSAAAIRELPAVEAEEVWLTQEVTTMSGLADRLRDEHQRARIAEAVAMGQVELVDPATPGSQVPVPRTRILLFGLLGGLLGGAGAAFGLERMNTSIRRRDEMETVLGVPGLAVIPQFATGIAQSSRRMPLLPMQHAPAIHPAGRQELVTVSDLTSSASEAYRTLRTNIIFSQVTQTIRRLVVTSPGPGEGKTTTAANLAVAFAQQGMRVLLVDCDLRRSRVHKVFGLPRSPGLAELVIGLTTIENVTHPTDIATLSVIPGGTSPPHPAELLGGAQMRALLDTLSTKCDLVILDTPPVLASADASVVSAAADGVVLVVRAGATERAAALDAVHQLAGVGGRVVGCVLNDADAAMVKYGTPHYYGYYSTHDQPLS